MLVSALVLAAGASMRMQNQHKLLLPWRDKPIIAHTIDNLLQARIAETLVVIGHGADQIQAVLRERPVRFVLNTDYARGMSTSIKAGLAACSHTADAILICLGDLPLVTANDIDLIITSLLQSQSATIAVPTFAGRRGNPVLFKIRHCAAMLELSGEVGCKTIIQQNPHAVVEVEMPNDHVLRDVDTMPAYAELLSLSQ